MKPAKFFAFLVFIPLISCNFNYSSSTLTFWYNILKSKAHFIIEKSAINSKCAKDLKDLIQDAFHRKVWAVQMLDANIKLNPGILAGNIYQFGNYDQCLEINEKRPNGESIIGQYCSVIIQPKPQENGTNPLEMDNMLRYVGLNEYSSHRVLDYLKAVFGFCLPKSCSIENLQSIWNSVESNLGLPVHAVFMEKLCDYVGKPVEPYAIDSYIFLFFGVVLVIVLACTVYDLTLTEEEREDNLLLACSLIYNSKKLLSTHVENDNLTCLYGIRVFSMMWVILGHRFLANSLTANTNSLYILKWKDYVENSNMIAATLSVDTFFVVSGALLCYIYQVQALKMKFTLSQFYFNRFFRLFPALLATVLFYIGVLKHLSRGPFWHIIIMKLARSCYYFWWSTFFFLTNQLSFKHQCLEQSWYLAVDTQLYMLSPLILFNIAKHRRRVITGIILAGLASIFYSLAVTVIYRYPASPADLDIKYFHDIYLPTFARMPAWLIGILFGYYIHEHRVKKISIPKHLNLFLWTLAVSTALGVIVSHVTMLSMTYNVVKAGFFNAIARPLWSAAMGFVIFACSTGHGGIVNTFLSLPCFIILGKLTYSMFLSHIIVQVVIIGRQRGARFFGTIENYHDFFGDYVAAVGFAAVVCLLFESPAMSFLNILGRRAEKRKKLMKVTGTKISSSKYNLWIFTLNKVAEEKKTD